MASAIARPGWVIFCRGLALPCGQKCLHVKLCLRFGILKTSAHGTGPPRETTALHAIIASAGLQKCATGGNIIGIPVKS